MASAVRCEATACPPASSKRDRTMTRRRDPSAERSCRLRAMATACPAAGMTGWSRSVRARNARPHTSRACSATASSSSLTIRRRSSWMDECVGSGADGADATVSPAITSRETTVFLVARTRAQRVSRVDCVPRSGDPALETLENAHLGGIAREEMKRMDRSSLTDAIDPSCPLLEPRRVPRQLKVDDHPAVMMKIEPFSCGVRGQKNRVPSARELLERQSPFPSGETAVKHRTGEGQSAPQVQERVAILSEDYRPFTLPEQTREQAGNRPQLRFASRRGRCRTGDGEQEPVLARGVVEDGAPSTPAPHRTGRARRLRRVEDRAVVPAPGADPASPAGAGRTARAHTRSTAPACGGLSARARCRGPDRRAPLAPRA